MFEKRQTAKSEEEILLEALRKSGIEFTPRSPDDHGNGELFIVYGDESIPVTSDELWEMMMSIPPLPPSFFRGDEE